MKSARPVLLALLLWILFALALVFLPLAWSTFNGPDGYSGYPRAGYRKPGIVMKLTYGRVNEQREQEAHWDLWFGLPIPCAHVSFRNRLWTSEPLTSSGLLLGSRAREDWFGGQHFNSWPPGWALPRRFAVAPLLVTLGLALALAALVAMAMDRLGSFARSWPTAFLRRTAVASCALAPIGLALSAAVPARLSSEIEIADDFGPPDTPWLVLTRFGITSLVAERIAVAEVDAASAEADPFRRTLLDAAATTSHLDRRCPVEIRVDRIGWPIHFLEGGAVKPSFGVGHEMRLF